MKLTKSLIGTFGSMRDGLLEQYESIDSSIAEREKEIKNLNKMKKEIEADLKIFESLIGKVETDGENQEAKS